MALQTSGPISLSEIKTELGSSSNSLRTLSAAAGFSIADSISEFYGYSAFESLHYREYDTNENSTWYDLVGNGSASSSKLSTSLWISPQWAATDTNAVLFELSPSGATTNANIFHLFYDYGLNRLIARYRSNSTNFHIHYPLSNNFATTGVSGAWHGGNQGNTNADGFVHLTMTYDGAQSTAANAFKLYWNGTELTSTVSASSGTRVNFGRQIAGINVAPRNGGGDRAANYDMVQYWDGVILSSANVSSLYNSGTPTRAQDVSLSASLNMQVTFENNSPVDGASKWTNSGDSGSKIAY